MDLKDIKEIEIYDRVEFLSELEKQLVIDPDRSAVVTVEMTQRRLNENTPLENGEKSVDSLISQTNSLLNMARLKDIPVIHIMSALRGVEVAFQEKSKWRQAMKKTGKSISPYGEIPDEFVDVQDGTVEPDFVVDVADTDYIIKTKKTFSCFYQTDLEWMLKTLKKDYIILAGLSSNADILSTAYDASNKYLGVITVKECVDSIYGSDLNAMALQQLGRCQGFVVDLETFEEKLFGKVTV
ncbi:cysteine hydrolase family protein [Aquibacillus albus]|uniref:Nicotinamidase-related amidase n=1 Tax=Aquibacillus albus TaxID=1168171 RepID=A0ABS2N6B5_9BACI|nr:isochorismatase family protein [Aquibacillus albus]MBM7573699.1 nicotinamidase-related amidase [Aquibacillus albus]